MSKTYYLTKYALTQGIEEVKTDDTPNEHGYFNVAGHYFSFRLGKDLCETVPDAIKRAEQMRTAKIASLKKSIAKLEQMEFK